MSAEDIRMVLAEMLAKWSERRDALLAAGCSREEAERLTAEAFTHSLQRTNPSTQRYAASNYHIKETQA